MRIISPAEFKVVALREALLPSEMSKIETPDEAVNYWNACIATSPQFNPEIETFAVLMLTTRRKVRGHVVCSLGTIDTILVDARSVFRVAIITSAAAIILAHNHPSGEATPSEADIKVTRDLIRAGQLLKIEVLDHIIIGNGQRVSLRELGHFY